MTVYVDNYEGRFRRMVMCHMFSDESIDELIQMAKKIGVDSRWIQHLGEPGKAVHFDICKSYREKALKAGAVHLPILGQDKNVEEWRRVRNAAKRLNREYIEAMSRK